MAQQYQLPDGRVVEALPEGGYRVVSGGQGIGPAIGNDPRLPFQTQKAQNDAAASQFEPGIKSADRRIKEAEATTAQAVAGAERDKAIADAKKAEFELKKLQTEQAKVDPKSGAYRALQGQIDRVTELYKKNLQGGFPNVVHNVVPDALQPEVGAFDSAAQGLANPFMAAFRIPGVGSQSDTELRQFLSANTPSQGDSDAVIEEKIGNVQRRLDSQLGTKPAAAPPQTQPDQMQLSRGGTRTVIDEFRRGVATRVGQMMAQPNVNRSQVEKFIRDNGLEPGSFNLPELFRYRQSPDFTKWQRANPGKPFPPDPRSYTREVPLSARESFNNSIGQSAPGAFAGAAANAISGNHLDDLAGAVGGNPEAVNTGLMLNQTAHPGASFMGDVAGQAMVEATLGKMPGLRAIYGKKLGQLGMDAAYGGYAGSGTDQGAVSGAIGNAAGGALFRGGSRVVGAGLKGVDSPSLNYLNQRDVPLTIGQVGRGSNSTVGQALGGIEDRFAGLPIADAIINSARRRGEEGFNRATFSEAGGSGLTGSAGVSELGGKVGNAYSFLDGVNLPIDAPFAGSQAGIRASLPRLPAFGNEIGRSMDSLDASATGGLLRGRDWQSGVRSARANRSSVRGQPFSDDAVGAINQIEDNLMGLAERQGPAGTIDNLTSANSLNGQYQTVLSALDNGPTQARGELFSPSRLDTASRQGVKGFGGRAASMRGERPFYELSKAGMDVMPNQVPDSGTAGRSLFYSALPGLVGGGGLGLAASGGNAQEGAQGAGIGAGASILPTLGLMALYSKGGQKNLQKLLLGPRSAHTKQVGSALLDPAVRRLFGMFGTATGRDLLLNQEINLQGQ